MHSSHPCEYISPRKNRLADPSFAPPPTTPPQGTPTKKNKRLPGAHASPATPSRPRARTSIDEPGSGTRINIPFQDNLTSVPNSIRSGYVLDSLTPTKDKSTPTKGQSTPTKNKTTPTRDRTTPSTPSKSKTTTSEATHTPTKSRPYYDPDRLCKPPEKSPEGKMKTSSFVSQPLWDVNELPK